MADVVINTKKESMYGRLVVLLSGIEYKSCSRFTPLVCDGIKALQEKVLEVELANAGKKREDIKVTGWDALFNLTTFVFPEIKREVFDTLDIGEIKEINERVNERILEPHKGMVDKKKT